MRASLLLAPLLLSLVACGAPRSDERPAADTMVIHYNRAGLVDIELRERMLVVVRKASDGVSSDPTRVGESTAGYRSRRRHARMHRAQMAAFVDWIEDHDVFAFDSRYGAGRPGTYASAGTYASGCGLGSKIAAL